MGKYVEAISTETWANAMNTKIIEEERESRRVGGGCLRLKMLGTSFSLKVGKTRVMRCRFTKQLAQITHLLEWLNGGQGCWIGRLAVNASDEISNRCDTLESPCIKLRRVVLREAELHPKQ